MLYRDDNGNAVYDEDTESLIAGGVVSLNNRSGSISLTLTTQSKEPVCFTEVPEGEYNLTMAVPNGYNPTTALNVPLTLQAGDRMYVSFGAQAAEPASTVPVEQPRRSPWLGVAGGALILLGVGLWFYARRITQQG